jgi:hypothetical protein
MNLRSLRTRVARLEAKLPDPAYCPGTCTPLQILEDGDPALPLPEVCEVCGRRPHPDSIRVVVVVRPG